MYDTTVLRQKLVSTSTTSIKAMQVPVDFSDLFGGLDSQIVESKEIG